MFLTKYCDARTASLIKQGSFKFGTLAGYRGIEAAGRFSDGMEGRHEDHYINSGDTVSARIGSIRLENNRMSPGAMVIGDRVEYDAWVFCSAIGSYSQQTHNALQNGCEVEGGIRYFGDRSLDSWVTFDGRKLLEVISSQLRRQLEGDAFEVAHQAVIYEKQPRLRGVFGPNAQVPLHEGRNFREAVFMKPHSFRPENEYRVCAFRIPINSSQYENMFMRSEDFASCVVASGH